MICCSIRSKFVRIDKDSRNNNNESALSQLDNVNSTRSPQGSEARVEHLQSDKVSGPSNTRSRGIRADTKRNVSAGETSSSVYSTPESVELSYTMCCAFDISIVHPHIWSGKKLDKLIAIGQSCGECAWLLRNFIIRVENLVCPIIFMVSYGKSSLSMQKRSLSA